MYFGKKAEIEWNEIVRIILILAAAAIIFLIFWTFIKPALQDAIEKTSCKDSVKLNAMTLVKFGGEEINPFSQYDLNCPTDYIIVKEGDSQDKAKEKVAKALWNCGDNFYWGELNIFEKKSETFCVVCSEITFESGFGEKNNKTITNFWDYLKTHKPGGPTSKKSYAEYLTPKASEYGEDELKKLYETYSEDAKKEGKNVNIEFDDTIDVKPNEIIKNNRKYVVMFMMVKKGKTTQLEAMTLTALSGLVFSPIPLILNTATIISNIRSGQNKIFIWGSDHEADWASAVVLVPVEQVSDVGCAVLK